MGIILEPFVYIISLVIDIYLNVVVLEVVLNWLIYFGVLKVNNRVVAKVMDALEALTQPVYAKIRTKIPPLNGIDFSPFILALFLLLLGRLLNRIMWLLF